MKPDTIIAARDAAHPDHHFGIGQVLGLALLGLHEYAMAHANGPGVLLDEGNITKTLAGVLQIFGA